MKLKNNDCLCCAQHQDIVNKAIESMPKEQEIVFLSNFFKVLADPTRVKMMCVLEQGEMCVCDIAMALSMTKSAISHQLSRLKKEKLVKSRREGKNVFYSIDDQHVSEVILLALAHIKHQKQ